MPGWLLAIVIGVPVFVAVVAYLFYILDLIGTDDHGGYDRTTFHGEREERARRVGGRK